MSFDLDDSFSLDTEDSDSLALDGAAIARITGRVARVDTFGDDYAECILWLVADDEFEDADGELRPGGHQVIRMRAKTSRLWRLTEACEVTAMCRFHRGQLALVRFEAVEDNDAPLPEVRLPKRKVDALNAADGHLPTLNEVDKAAREGGWGALNHSVYRFAVPVHITMAPKCRTRAFDGYAIEVQMLGRQVAEAEGLKVIAIAAEGDHIHLLGIPAGPGGMAPTWNWAAWIGRWKALTSRRIKMLPGLDEFAWQTGYAIAAVAGGKQGAEEALAVVEAYVRAQGDQSKAASLSP